MKYKKHVVVSNRQKGSPIYLIPNMFTLGAMFAGFYAIIQSINHNFYECGIAILFAMILDSLDGRVARLTRTTSPFGAQLDSLSDMVNFGIAPAIIAFNWHLQSLGKLGWCISFLYCACAGLRLARFNTMLDDMDKRFFTGLPSPSAAILVVGFVYLYKVYHFHGNVANFLGAFVTIIAAISMVSNIKFYSFKEYNFHHRGRFRGLIIFLLMLSLLIIYPEFSIYGFFVIYLLVSYIMWIFRIGYAPKNRGLTVVSKNHKVTTHQQ